MRRRWLLAALLSAGCAASLIAWLTATTGAQDPDKGIDNGKKGADSPLPIRQVVLFNSGVGYLQREGAVEGNAQIELAFPVSDINDLLKSLVLQDLGGGKISTVAYDSHDPIEKTLGSFALDLNGNPTFGQILNQARGEKIEVLLRPGSKDAAPAKIQGTIVGMEVKRRPIGKDPVQVVEMDTLNLSGQSGLQSVNLEDVLGVRFQNPTLENEFQRALRVLASSHDVQKKAVTLGFAGAGKRAVRVGYVVERPIWKTTYRLRIEANGKIFLQGWALVENPSDDDWNDVRMVLVSGRPISFQMDLYQPLYIPRPTVEPELFASLRPPVYEGTMPFNPTNFAQGFVNPLGGGGNLGAPQGGIGGGPPPISQGGPADIGAQGFIGGQITGNFNGGAFNGGQAGQGLNPMAQLGNIYQQNPRGSAWAQMMNNRLTFEDLQERRRQALQAKDEAKEEAKEKGPAIAGMAGLDFKEGIDSVAAAAEVGDYYQYVIDQRITLARQKSAMLPILDQHIEGAKVSIYNESVQAKHPLLGLKLKNTSGQPLTQGPITVYDSSTYAGDTRILDLQPGEERLLSYALDTGTEIKTEVKSTPAPDMTFRLGEPNLTARYQMRRTTTYSIKNRSTAQRSVILEHPIEPSWQLVGNQGAEKVDGAENAEKTRSHYRFTVIVAAGKTASHDVLEQQARVDSVALAGAATPFYAIGAGIAVKPMVHHDEDKLVGLKIEKGFLIPMWKSRESRTYHVQNLSSEDRNFTIDHVIRSDWARIDPKGEPQAGPGVHRFKLDVSKGKTASQGVVEERVHAGKGTWLKTAPEPMLREYLQHPTPRPDVKAALTRTLMFQVRAADALKQAAELERQLKTAGEDQARLRENLKIVPPSSDVYKKFLDKFVTQESEIDGLQKTLRQAQAVLTSTQRDFDAFVATLNAE